MSEDDDLARRFFALWAEYLAALLADPQAVQPLLRWLARPAGDGHPGAASGPPAGTAAAAHAYGERDAAVAELARRIDELAERVAALERRRRPVGGARRRTRAAQS